MKREVEYENEGVVLDFVSDFTGGKRTIMKMFLCAIETLFPNVSVVAVDTNKDAIIYGHEYVNEQEARIEDLDD